MLDVLIGVYTFTTQLNMALTSSMLYWCTFPFNRYNETFSDVNAEYKRFY